VEIAECSLIRRRRLCTQMMKDVTAAQTWSITVTAYFNNVISVSIARNWLNASSFAFMSMRKIDNQFGAALFARQRFAAVFRHKFCAVAGQRITFAAMQINEQIDLGLWIGNTRVIAAAAEKKGWLSYETSELSFIYGRPAARCARVGLIFVIRVEHNTDIV